MKHVIFVLFALGSVLILGCDRKHNCVCDKYFEGTFIETEGGIVLNGSLKNVKEECRELSDTIVNSGLTETRVCALRETE